MEICWTVDNGCGPVAKSGPSNLLMSYYLVPALALGGQEWVVHLLQLVTLWLGIAGTVSLALRFGMGMFGAVAAGLMLTAMPPVLAMTSTAMPDVLAMSLGVIGIERLWARKQEQRFTQGAVTALALGLGPFTRMHLALLWPIAALLLRNDGRILNVRDWWAIKNRYWPPLISVLVWIGALALTAEHRGTVGLGFFWLYPQNVSHNLRSYFIQLMAAMPLGVAWLVLRNRRINSWLLIAMGALAIWTIIWIRPGPGLWLCGIFGFFVLADIFLWAFQSRNLQRIALALWLLLPLVALPNVQLPVKYLVACAPAAALLIVDVSQSFRWRKAALGGIVAAEVIVASMVLHSDAKLAEMGREAAARLIRPHVAAGHRVWFASQWGFYWYALKAGARPLWTDQVPTPGDYLARGEMEGYAETLKRLPPAILVETYTVAGLVAVL
jgi:hypothetical protein